MAYFFTPPTIPAAPPIYVSRDPFLPVSRVAQRLFRHYKPRDVGQSVLKNHDGTYTTKLNPSQLECEAALVVYLGGHIYPVSDTEATALQGAGFTVTSDGGTPTPPSNAGTYVGDYTTPY